MGVFGVTAALCLAALSAPVEAPGGPLVTVVCEGPVEMTTDESGRARLILSGGVRVERGELTASARRGELDVGGEGEAPETVSLEGDVVLESPRFGAEADAARLLRAGGASEEGAAARDFTVTLERRAGRAIDLRAGTVRITCGGPVVYRESADGPGGKLAVSGRLRAETRTFVFRADSGVITIGRAAPGRAEKGEEGSGMPIPAAPGRGPPPTEDREREAEVGPAFGVTRIELAGSVDIVTKAGAGEGAAPRKAHASRAVYVAAEDLLVLRDEPGPEIESGGVVLTAPEEIHLYVGEGRIEAPKGPMRAVIGPRRPGRAADPRTAPRPEEDPRGGAER